MKIFLTVTAVIVGLILLLFLLILCTKASLRIRYRKKIKVTLTLLGIPITLYSSEKEEKKKRKKQKDLSKCRNPDRILQKELRRQQRAAQKAREKRRKAALKRRKKQAQKQAKKEEISPNLKEKLEMILAIVKRFYEETQGQIKLRVHRMHLYIATGDAAKTAILYGVVSQSAAYLLAWLDEHFMEVSHKKGALLCTTDYTAQASRADVDLRFSIGIIDGIRLAIKLYSILSEEKTAAKKKALLRQKAAQEQTT